MTTAEDAEEKEGRGGMLLGKASAFRRSRASLLPLRLCGSYPSFLRLSVTSASLRQLSSFCRLTGNRETLALCGAIDAMTTGSWRI